ncbi:IclR family transcriptional regulator [Salmonella enterica]|uniref:HTH-type transcriptional repressor AllR n=14 Tax=Salmonella enterica TaxID=28901 RepID=A0A624BB75_SALMO|nr:MULTISPECIES: IclR family transcriptional regulator [Salmonella]EAA0922803.1 IclR family transcriptional regulator [Salmonella enterica subsp. enterica serovar Enteritidis]EAA3831521.1 IclR family transcriptional regulator [Salmonella enterica subsp. enterica serovar Pomona]EAA5432215.1 IclR family transcriptional regulator [Salmonella enterica subsp. enterica serovar Falkensee]EAA7937916.1 IclR family transcriptional regulator [Salmonella enterica subsp. enterica serovar Teko]EAA9453159.1 
MATTKNIQSIERAFAILELFQKNREELGIKEISQMLDLNKSTAFGFVNTLFSLGYLHQNEQTQRYSLGPKVLGLSNAAQIHNIIIRSAHPYLEMLSDQFGETAHCAVEVHGSVIYLDKVEAQGAIYINTQIGAKSYIHCTGVGKCILAYMSPERKEAILSRKLTTMTYNTLSKADQLRENLSLVVQRGYAIDNEEIEIGLSCIAVPVFNAPNKVACAISISGFTPRMQESDKQEKMIKTLQQYSQELSVKLYQYHPHEEFKQSR